MAKYQKATDSDEPVKELQGKSLFDRVDEYLTAHDWNYTANEEKGGFYYGLSLKETNSRVMLEVTQKDLYEYILIYTIFPFFTPEHRRSLMADALNRINFRLAANCFEMDCADGEVRLRSFVESDAMLSEAMLDRALSHSYATADRYQAALLAVAFGNALPDTVIEMASRTEDSKLQ